MIDEQEIRSAITNILHTGLVSIRCQGARGWSQYCKIEADHLHNLPQILFNFSEPLVDYYYRIERPIYMRECRENQAEMEYSFPAGKMYAEEWKPIAAYLEQGR